MVKTVSTMLELGTEAPDFELIDVVSGNRVTRGDFGGRKGLLAMFICAHCPYVKHMESALAALGTDYLGLGLGLVAFSSNDVGHYPEDAPDKLREQATNCGFNFPYLYDEHQHVAKAYTAACTPDFFLFDADFSLVYRGQLDDSRPDTDIPVTGEDLRKAIDQVLAGEELIDMQKPSLGCNIKWIPGEEPAYFA